MSTLAPFQRATSDWAIERLWGAEAVPRVLVADEVGLGKTHVAQAIVDKTLKRFPRGHVDVLYVCSNQAISSQNLGRLVPHGLAACPAATRLTLLSIEARRSGPGSRVRFLALTPQTSLEVGRTPGRVKERALIWVLLRRALRPTGLEDLLRERAGLASWQRDVGTAALSKPDRAIAAAFLRRVQRDAKLLARVRTAAQAQAAGLLKPEDRRAARDLIGELRQLLAEEGVRCLANRALVILDEFQRFAPLLQAGPQSSFAARLMARLLSEGGGNRRVLLLSATPYRMPGSVSEVSLAAHADLVSLMEFLSGPDAAGALDIALQRYARALRAQPCDEAEILLARDGAGRLLRRVMARTERTSASAGADAMVTERAAVLPVEPGDLRAAVSGRRIALEQRSDDPTEYWKSAPYFLEFMTGYKLKDQLRRLPEPKTRKLQTQARRDDLLLNGARLRALDPVAFPNARLRALVAEVLPPGTERLLWIPPSAPYTAPSGAFARANPDLKRLLFSEWRLAPDAISALISYEIERRLARDLAAGGALRRRSTRRRSSYQRFGKSPENLRLLTQRGRGGPITLSNGTLALLLPSRVLAELGDPLALAWSRGEPVPRGEAIRLVEARLKRRLRETFGTHAPGGAPDESWYWAAPLLMEEGEGLRKWLTGGGLFPEQLEQRQAGERAMTEALDRVARGLGPQPKDLVRVLALNALSGPAVCALRALRRSLPHCADVELQTAAGQVGLGLRSLFNGPEATAAIEVAHPKTKSYWRQVLEYGLDGNLQALLDEQAHMVAPGLGSAPARRKVSPPELLGEALSEGMQLRRAAIDVRGLRKRQGPGRSDGLQMRCRHAMPFREVHGDDGISRLDAVRNAFNSPFRPFVLASTSVGQEGLDFHVWCHAVVHWNLPRTPVEVEQREGRVHRYKGHAVRLNVAKAIPWREVAALGADPAIADPWQLMFALAANRPNRNKLAPFWMFEGCDAPRKVQRIIPMLSLSREADAWPRLRNRVATYRLALGLPRHADLIQALDRSGITEDQARLWTINLSPDQAAV